MQNEVEKSVKSVHINIIDNCDRNLPLTSSGLLFAVHIDLVELRIRIRIMLKVEQ